MQGKSICGRTTPQQCAFGSAVREVRARRGLSQEGLGFEAGLHRNYVGALERGEVNPTFKTLVLLCAGLAVPISELMVVYERQADEQVWTAVHTT